MIDSLTEVVNALDASGAGGLSGDINEEVTSRQLAVSDLQMEINILRGVILTLEAGNYGDDGPVGQTDPPPGEMPNPIVIIHP